MKHFESYYALCKNQDWIEEKTNKTSDLPSELEYEKLGAHTSKHDYQKLFTQACIHLQRVYKVISERYCNSSEEKIEYLIKGLDVCRESKLKKKINLNFYA
jgi:hypothetical protein